MTTPSWRLPRRRDALSYWLRTRLLSFRASIVTVLSRAAPRWRAAEALRDAPVVAQHRSALWTDGDGAEFVLTAGKIENLRRAVSAFQGVVVPADGVLSFWTQLGRPSARRGFVVGREIREGCVVPTVAGGICQLSNALADVAVQAGLTFVERHGHTARVGADPGQRVDATLFWRHVDLKLRAGHAWRLEVSMNASELVVSLRAHTSPASRAVTIQPRRVAAVPARGCLNCDELQCFRHAGHLELRNQMARVAVLLDAWTPEFAAHLQHLPADHFAPLPLRLAFWRPGARAWEGVSFRARWASVRGTLWRRLWARRDAGRRQAAILDAQRWLARAYAAALTPVHTRIVVDQALLPHLEAMGALAGREVEVLVHSLPMRDIHARLDHAAQRWPRDGSLRDFRAPAALVDAETRGLARAHRLVTAHAEAAAVLERVHGGKVQRLDWVMVPTRQVLDGVPALAPLLLFPAPALPRKGSRELAVALAGLDCRLRVLGRPEAAAWPGIELDTDDTTDMLYGVAAVVLPAYVEHAPRVLLRALAQGLPVVATPACGLDVRPGLTIVEAGNIEALRTAVITALVVVRVKAANG